MKTMPQDLIKDNKVFVGIAAATALLLSIPYLAMKYNWQVPDPGSSVSDGINWSTSDFAVMGTLIFTMASIFVLIARKIERKNLIALAFSIVLMFFYIWVELAVGVFTHIGS